VPAGVALFRALILASVVTGLAGSFLDLAHPGLIPSTLSAAFNALPATRQPALVATSILFVVTFGGTITAVIGLYYFQPWSRKLAFAMTLLGLLFDPLLGVSVRSGWAQLLVDFSTLLWGGVIGMSFFSSLSQRFERT